MTRTKIAPLALGAVLLGGLAFGPAIAHHSVSAQFDYDRPFAVKGTLSKIEWINPHSYLRVVVMEGGKQVTWNIESHGIQGMRKVGLDKEVLKVGNIYEVKGYRARNGTPSGYLTQLITADGKVFNKSTEDPN